MERKTTQAKAATGWVDLRSMTKLRRRRIRIRVRMCVHMYRRIRVRLRIRKRIHIRIRIDVLEPFCFEIVVSFQE